MTDSNQFGSARPSPTVDATHCSRCEAMLADALDQVLSASDQAFFELHLTACPACSSAFADATRGAAWLQLLRSPRPEPSADLLGRILLQTTGLHAAASQSEVNSVPAAAPGTAHVSAARLSPFSHPAALAPSGSPAYAASAPHRPDTLLSFRPGTRPPGRVRSGSASVLPFRERVHAWGQNLLQPRLAMTAAMAFFSIALTLNLTGVNLTELHASDLKPSSIRRTLFQANAHVIRYYDSLRVVYELESRVHDLEQSSSDAQDTPSSSAANSATHPHPDPSSQPSQKNPDPAPAQTPTQTPAQTPDQNLDQTPGHAPHQKPSRNPGPGSSLRQFLPAGLRLQTAACALQLLPHIAPRLATLLPRSQALGTEGALL